MNFVTKSFSELTTTELYKMLQLRSEVFVVEQDCVYQDLDFKIPVGKNGDCYDRYLCRIE